MLVARPSCGAANLPNEQFCGECGTSLSASASSASTNFNEIRLNAKSATSEEIAGERKFVTALFADLKGSTELLESLDPEEGRTIVEPLLGIMSDAVRRYEGYLVRTTGDGVFALFGAPVAYEDHPQRALYAALLMQLELRAMRGCKRRRDGQRSKRASGCIRAKSWLTVARRAARSNIA
jgi:class 3 adenylate cyclase